MRKRPSTFLDGAVAGFIRALGKVAGRLVPTAPASRPAGGPVVFRHYL